MSDTAKLKIRKLNDDSVMYVFWCPGCQETHSFDVGPDKWKFNGDMEKPSFFPSLKYERCHLMLRDGVIQYCGDSRHRYRNRDVPLQEF